MQKFPRAGLTRRLASLTYDGLVIIALSMLTIVIYLLIIQSLISINMISLGQHDDVSSLIQATPLLYGVRSILLILASMLFFGYFWKKSGQTIGMRAWRLKVQTLDGQLLNWPTAMIRSLVALLGIGNIWVLIDFKHKRALQDILCGTEVIVLSKEENKRVYRSLE